MEERYSITKPDYSVTVVAEYFPDYCNTNEIHGTLGNFIIVEKDGDKKVFDKSAMFDYVSSADLLRVNQILWEKLMTKEINKAEEFVTKVKEAYLKEFPNGWIRGGIESGLGKYICFTTGIQPKEKISNKIEHNDPARQVFMIHECFIHRNTDELKEKVTVELACGGSVYIKPDEGSYYAYCTVKFGFRKKTGDIDKIYDHFVKYFKKMRKVVDENRDNIPYDLERGE